MLTFAVIAANPDNAYNELIRLQRLYFPEIEDELKVHDDLKLKIMEEERKYVWMLTRDKDGHLHAQRKPIEEMPEDDLARQIHGQIHMKDQLKRQAGR